LSQKGRLTEQEEQRHKALFGAIKNKSLLRVAVLYYSFFFGSETGPLEAVKQKLWAKGIAFDNRTLAFSLEPSDVAPLIHVSEKTAQEYIDLLKLLMM